VRDSIRRRLDLVAAGDHDRDVPPPPTQRLVFRTWYEADLPLAIALWGDPRVTALVGGPFTDQQVRDRLVLEIETERVRGFSYWPIFTHAGDHIGCCGLKPKHEAVSELGFYIRPAAWGRACATEAGRAVIAHAFGTIGATALFAGHHPDNVASGKTLAKLGFRYTHHELYPPTGLSHPGYELCACDT
jgi:RimJ/RimL family protein N-acetyltransferase